MNIFVLTIRQVEFHGECNECGDAGAAAVCCALLQLRAANVAAVRAVFLWKNELGDKGAMAVAELLEQSSVPGQERLWIAEVRVRSVCIARACVCVQL